MRFLLPRRRSEQSAVVAVGSNNTMCSVVLYFCLVVACGVTKALATSGPGFDLHEYGRQASSCSSSDFCNEGFVFPVYACVGGTCQRIGAVPQGFAAPLTGPVTVPKQGIGADCYSIRACEMGLVCAVGSPVGKCASGAGILGLTNFMLNLEQEDFTGDPPVQKGPTKVSRAFAIIMLAAHDAYVLSTGEYPPKLLSAKMPKSPKSLSSSPSQKLSKKKLATAAMHASALTAAKQLFTEPDMVPFIDAQMAKQAEGVPPAVVQFGKAIGNLWISTRSFDNSTLNQVDSDYTLDNPFSNQPDPNGLNFTLGRNWKHVTPFVLKNVEKEAFLPPPPNQFSKAFKQSLKEVAKLGKCGKDYTVNGKSVNDTGIFWAYDGAIGIGTPPKLYMQVVLQIPQVQALDTVKQVRLMTAAAVSMGDAGIAAWFWKYKYDYPRPVIAIRLLSPSMNDWNPRGAPPTNDVSNPHPPCSGITPNFPAYPSGHATFGTAVFETVAKLLGVSPSSLSVTFTSDEFNHNNTEPNGEVRKLVTSTFSLSEAIQDNLDSRVYLGVHWRFDGTGGAKVGSQIASKMAAAFKF
jgi:hypothetical protein